MTKSLKLAGVAGLTLALAACSGGGEPEKKTADAAPAAPAAAPAAPAAPAAAPAAPAGAPAATDVATLDGTQLASFTGNAAAGKLVFAQCRTCHVTDAGVNKTGPSMHQIIGRAAGTVAGYNYSPANKGSGITWTKEKLFQYLEKPQRIIPNTKMIFAGIPDAQKRADLIAYLEAPQ
jgi:cytochrome c